MKRFANRDTETMIDPISDMLTRIRNAQIARHKEVLIPTSRLKLAIAKILEQRQFIDSVQEIVIQGRPMIKVVLRYYQPSRTEKEPAIREIRRVSRQGQRRYIRTNDIRKVKNGLGLAIISTSKGVMSGEEARKNGLGGEFICEIW